MKIAEIKSTIAGTGFDFMTYHDFSGVYDRYRENHNLLKYKDNVCVCIKAKNDKRDKWCVLVSDTVGRIIYQSEYVTLSEALILAKKQR